MSTIIKSVDKTSVKFQESFNYTINVSFNGIVGDINSAKVTDFFPSYLSYTLPSSIPHLQNVIEESVEGGTLVTFDFGSITDLGIAITINIACQFVLGTDSLTSVENSSEIYINDELYESSTALAVTLSVEEDFIIEKDIPVPNARLGAAGGRVIFSIVLKNRLKNQGGNGDPGAKITDIEITDTIPTGLTIDSNYPVSGRDISISPYADTRYDGRTATIVDNNISFSIPDYYGTEYRIVCVCNVDSDITATQLSNTAYLSIGGTSRDSSTSTLNIGDAEYRGSIIKYGPNYGSVGNNVSFDLSVGNYGNVDLMDFIIEDIIPDEVDVYRINTGSFQLDVLYISAPQPYNIEYLVNDTEPYILLGNYNTGVAQYVTLPTLSSGEKITKIRWNIPNMAVGMITNRRITIDGIVNSAGADNTFTNLGQITYDDDTGTNIVQATHITDLNDKSELNLSKSIVNNKTSFNPGEIIRYSLKFTGAGSQVNNPVVSDLLSEKLQYIGNEKDTFYDYFDDTTIDSTNSNFYNIVPIVKEIQENYNNANSTLVTYNLDGFSLKQKGQFIIEFDTKVNVGAVGSIVNYGIIGNKGDNAVVGSGGIPYSDVDDRDKDGITNETILRSRDNTTNIAYFNELTSNKKVKGALDENYSEEPDVGLTYEGGDVDYKLIVSNMGNLPYNYIQIVDILPHIGDTGVLSTNVNRLSQFPIYFKDIISANIVENDTIVSNVNILVEYSKSYDPLRFGSDNFGDDNIGVDNDWTTTVPNPLTDIKSIRITMENFLLQPNQSIIVDLYGLAPVGVSENLVSWNSIAVKARYVDENGQTQKILPVEPEKVGVRVQNTNKGKITGKAWNDTNKNGNIDSGELFINGVTVKLLSANMSVVDETITSNDLNDIPGNYMFNNIDVGEYYIQFIKPSGMNYTLYNQDTQNRADSLTGLTEKFIIPNTDLTIEDIHGGFIEGVDLVILLLDLLNNDIYSIDCSSKSIITQQVQYSINKLIDIVELIVAYFNQIISDTNIKDFGYKAQVQRMLDILSNLNLRLKAIVIQENYCNNNLISNIIFITVDIILELIKILEVNYGLNMDDSCTCLKIKLNNIIMGEFINSITNLDIIIEEFSKLIYVLNINQNTINKNYVASYQPKTRIIPSINKFNQSHYCSNKNNKCR